MSWVKSELHICPLRAQELFLLKQTYKLGLEKEKKKKMIDSSRKTPTK
jgi:hypothetical protein